MSHIQKKQGDNVVQQENMHDCKETQKVNPVTVFFDVPRTG